MSTTHPPRRSHRAAQIAARRTYTAIRDEAPDCPYTYNRALNAATSAAIRAGALDDYQHGRPSQISAQDCAREANRAYNQAAAEQAAIDAADEYNDDEYDDAYDPAQDYADYAADEAELTPEEVAEEERAIQIEQDHTNRDRETRGYYPPRPDRIYPEEE